MLSPACAFFYHSSSQLQGFTRWPAGDKVQSAIVWPAALASAYYALRYSLAPLT